MYENHLLIQSLKFISATIKRNWSDYWKPKMYEGTPSKGIDFFNLLNESVEFCMELGKVTLAAGN